MPNLLDKITKGLREANLTIMELKDLAKIAPHLKKVWDNLLKLKQKNLKACTTEELLAIDKFINTIGFEITPAQPDEEQMQSIMAVPGHIKKLLLTLLPFAKEPLLTLLYAKARPYDNLNEIWAWLSCLEELYSKLACQKFPPTQRRFFNHIFEFTENVGLDYALLGMNMILSGEFSLDELKPFFEELRELQPILSRKTNDYEPIYYSESDITSLLEQNQSPYLKLLENAKSASLSSSFSQSSQDSDNDLVLSRTTSLPTTTFEESESYRRPIASQ